MRLDLWTVIVSSFLFLGCPVGLPTDDDAAGDDDVADDDGADDDTTPPGDLCDDYPGEIICDFMTALTCDANGDIAAEEECDTANEFSCFPGMGCILCYPAQRWCEGNEVVECNADGLSWAGVTYCDPLLGDICEGGICISLCDKAEQQRSSIGCKFYGVDMEQDLGHINLAYAIVASNVHETLEAQVEVHHKNGATWDLLESRAVAPQALEVFPLPNNQISGTGLVAGNAYRLTSHIPIIAYQFNPLDGVSSFSSDASLMLPASAYDTFYRVPAWGSQYGNSDLNVIAEQDGTQVWITPTVDTAAGGGVPAGQAGVQFGPIVMDEGDVLQVTAPPSVSLEGSVVEADTRVAVFAGHMCANIPPANTWCDHIEEQIFGIQTWGDEYLGARLPVRSQGTPEVSVWHFMAGNDATTLTFEANAWVTGLPPGNQVTLQPGQVVEYQISGAMSDPGDFYVTGSEAFLVTQFMIGELWGGDIGDPCMVQAVPVEQFLESYVVLVPPTWVFDRMVITRHPLETVTVNGTNIDQWPLWSEFTYVTQDWEVVRIEVQDGPYLLEGSAPFGVQITGFDDYDSYCYPGGLNQAIINDL